MNDSKNKLFLIKGSRPQTAHEENSEGGREVLLTFEEALAKFLDPLYATAVRLTKDPEMAKDLVQEAGLRAFQNFSQLSSGIKVKAWLFKILMNTFINEYRKKLKVPPVIDIDIVELFDHSLLDGHQTRYSPEEALLQNDMDHEITMALNNLHVDFRSVVWLSDVEGFSTKEVSEIIGVPPGTIASRLYRSRRLLKESLQEYALKRGIIKE